LEHPTLTDLLLNLVFSYTIDTKDHLLHNFSPVQHYEGKKLNIDLLKNTSAGNSIRIIIEHVDG
jgi:hypothetical protein